MVDCLGENYYINKGVTAMPLGRATGFLIRLHRENKKYSRETCAELCDLSDRCISNIERGVADPKFSTVVKLCKTCDIDIRELYEEYLKELNITDDE